MPKLIFFDLDGTLTVSKSDLTEEMAGLLAQLLERTKVCVVSGGALPQFLTQVVAHLPQGTHLEHLYLEPTSGAALYEHVSGAAEPASAQAWQKIYEERISEADAALITKAAQEGAEATGFINFKSRAWGERLEYRGSQVTLSALGQQAPVYEKLKWDPDKAKRMLIRAEIQKRLPFGYMAAMGGATSIDITKSGIGKAYGIHQLCERLTLPEPEALYVGDQLVAGGNDEAAFDTDVATKAVASPEATAALIRELLAKA